MSVEDPEKIGKNLELIMKELLEIKEYLGMNPAGIANLSLKIPADHKTVSGIYSLIEYYNLSRVKLLSKTQKLPDSLIKFSLVAKIEELLLKRDLTTGQPEKVLLQDKDGSTTINLNNWHKKPINFLKNYVGKEIVFLKVNLKPVYDNFIKNDGDWILNWDGDFFEKKEMVK